MNKRDGEIQVYLFDHALLFTKLVKTKHVEQYKVYRRVRFILLIYHLSAYSFVLFASQYRWNCY